jgi:hypothetical protein
MGDDKSLSKFHVTATVRNHGEAVKLAVLLDIAIDRCYGSRVFGR